MEGILWITIKSAFFASSIGGWPALRATKTWAPYRHEHTVHVRPRTQPPWFPLLRKERARIGHPGWAMHTETKSFFTF